MNCERATDDGLLFALVLILDTTEGINYFCIKPICPRKFLMSFCFYFKGIIPSLEVKIGNNTSSLRSYMDELSTTKMLWKDVLKSDDISFSRSIIIISRIPTA